jgi:hypothetical protein
MVVKRDHLQLRDSVGISPTSLPRGTVDLSAFAHAPTEKPGPATYCGRVDPQPKRSLGDTIGQLVVIAVLIAILIGAIVLLRDYVDSHNSGHASIQKTTFRFSCCSGFNPNVVYHPGETIRLAWMPVATLSSQYASRTITLDASLSHSYTSVHALKSSVQHDTKSAMAGPFIATTGPSYESNRSGTTPVLTLQIPLNARTGYYNIVTSSSSRDSSVSGAAIIEIHR